MQYHRILTCYAILTCYTIMQKKSQNSLTNTNTTLVKLKCYALKLSENAKIASYASKGYLITFKDYCKDF